MLDVANLQSLLSLYDFNTAFRIAALKRVAPLIASDAELAKSVAAALSADEATRKLEAERAKQVGPDSRADPEAVELDRQIDRAIAAIPAQLDAILGMLPPGDAQAVEARAFVAELLPRGVAAVVQTTFVEELSECDRILEHLQQNAAKAQRFGFAPLQQRLAGLVASQREVLGRVKATPISLDVVRAAQYAGREALAAIVIRIAAAHAQPTAEAIATRRKLLQPVVELNEQLREAYRRSGGRVADALEPAPEATPAPK